MLGRYGKIFALGHRAAEGLLERAVTVEEKVDGSQVSWGLLGGDPPRLLGLLRLRLPWYHACGA